MPASSTNQNETFKSHSEAESLNFALTAAGIGIWNLNLDASRMVIWDARCRELFGLATDDALPYETVLSYIYEEDRAMVDNAVKKALSHEGDGSYHVKFRVSGVNDNILRLVKFTGQAYFDDKGNAYRFTGVATDISAEMTAREDQLKLRVLLENSPDVMSIAGKNGEVLYLNPATYKVLGIDPGVNYTDLNFKEFYSPGEFLRAESTYKTFNETGSWTGILNLSHFKTGEVIPFAATLKRITNPETNEVIGRSGHLRDLRPELNAQKALLAGESKFRNVTDTSPTGLWLSDPEGNLTYLNHTLTQWTGMPYENLLGTGWANAIIDEDREKGATAFITAINNRSHYDVEFRIKKGNGDIIWCKAAGDPFYHEDGTYGGYAGFCMDIDERVNMLSDLQKNEERIRSIVEQAPVAIGVLRGRDFIIESGNDAILRVWGKERSIIGLKLSDALPEIKDQQFIGLLENVYDTGKTFYGYEVLARIQHKSKLEDSYFDFVYAPLKNDQGDINGILVIASEVTTQVLAKKHLEESEARFRGLIENAPVATGVFVGKDLVIDVANEPMLRFWGKGDKVMGMPLAEAVPELKNQPFIKILEDIFVTKQPYHEQDAKCDLVVNGKLQTFYFNFTYQPLFDSNGEVYAIMDMAIDVTDHVLSRNKIAKAEARLRIAIETANLATWQINIHSNEFLGSDRLKNWFGFDKDEVMTFEEVLKCLPEKGRLISAVRKAKESNGAILDVEYTVINRKSGRKHILHTVGQTFYNEAGEPYLLTGSTKDITLQRNTEYELESLVQNRTEELQASNEELETTNEELAETNDNLSRSNEELAQYAYVASHDLQEPLRKIRVFSDILSNQPSLSADNKPMVEKINQASERMTLLIKDLLEFSRLLNSEKLFRSFELKPVITEVINDFELVITEKKAKINVAASLPVIDAVPLQMNQLFYNLVNNALKFIKAGEAPEIEIDSKELSSDEIKKYIPRFNRNNKYYDITVKDKGIGFDTKYADQIFEVFKRLHGREVYPGSGIGLALCRRIVINHGGHLYAESEPGKGTTFHIILPDKH